MEDEKTKVVHIIFKENIGRRRNITSWSGDETPYVEQRGLTTIILMKRETEIHRHFFTIYRSEHGIIRFQYVCMYRLFDNYIIQVTL